jgi:hypothetical protein
MRSRGEVHRTKMERITSIDFFLHQITENQGKKPRPTKSTARGYPGCSRSGQDHTYQRRRSRPAGLESPWWTGSWIAQQANRVAARIGDGGGRWRGAENPVGRWGRRARWVDAGGELDGSMPAARWVGGRGRRAQRPCAKPKDLARGLRFLQGTHTPAAHPAASPMAGEEGWKGGMG